VLQKVNELSFKGGIKLYSRDSVTFGPAYNFVLNKKQ